MAITSIARNEVFQLGQFKAQVLSINTTGAGSNDITNAVLKTAGGVSMNFSRVHAVKLFSNTSAKVHTVASSTGRLSKLVLALSADACTSLLIIGE